MRQHPGKKGTPADERKRLLELMLRKKGLRGAGQSAGGEIRPRSASTAPPLSHAQQRLWFLDELTPQSTAYVFCNLVHLTGRLDLEALRRAYRAIVDRHEIFRTCFRQVDGVPRQIIHPQLQLDIPHIDLTGVAAAERERRLRQLAREEASRPFDLEQAPLLRITTVQLSATRHAVLQTMHHIVYDGWSLAVLFRELKALYESFAQGQDPVLPSPDIQYADYALWQREYLETAPLRRQLEYWRETLSGRLPVLELPADHPRPPVQSFNGALHRIELPAGLTRDVHALAQRAECTPFMVLLAAFDVLLHRYTGETDILVGTPIANRNQPQIESLIGFFVNSLVLRTSLEGDPDSLELLRRVRSTTSAAYSHQDLPFERLVDELQPQRDLSHNPLFQVMFVLQNTPEVPTRLGDNTLGLEEVDNGTSLFDITFNLYESRDGIHGYIEYCRDLFEPETVQRLAGHYLTLLEGMVADPRRRISQLTLVTAAERDCILHTWNDTAADYPRHRAVHQLIEAQAQQQPDAPAVCFDAATTSYADLNADANRLAHLLIRRGVQPGDFVGLCTERGVDMLTGILGILKAGAAYLPLDPHYPVERLAYMLKDSAASLLVSRSALMDQLPVELPDTVLLDRDADQLADQPASDPGLSIRPDQPAYAIYTSGSTGTPKGVQVTHANLVHSTCARLIHYPEPVRAYLLLSSFSFDSSVAGIFWTLCQGGMLVLPRQGEEQDILAVAELIRRTSASHVLALPSLYGLLLQLAPAGHLRSLNTVIVAGEACPPPLVRRHHERLPDARLYNEYGPTEATVWCTVCEVPPQDDDAPVPIGRPIPNMQAYVLDAGGQPLPAGIPGELYVGGDGVTPGYLNQPRLTADRFVPSPFHADGRRLYRTGDLARFRADGMLEFLGRVDDQVKIRGYRIELGEIEAALAMHPDIHEAVVLAVEAQHQSGLRLAAWYVAREGASVTTQTLRAHLQPRLPDYMIPAAMQPLERIPLMPNGKVDRAALPAPTFQDATGQGPEIAPRTEAEARLAAIWSEVLGLERVGVEDNFFELGGDSIVSIQIIARARQAGLDLKPRQLFEHQTIAGLAAAAGSLAGTGVEPGPFRGEAPMTPIQCWFFEHAFGNPHHWNQPALLELRRDIDDAALAHAFERLARHHDMLRARFLDGPAGWRCIVGGEAERIDIEMLDLSALPPARRQAAFDELARRLQTGLDITNGPLLRAARISGGPGSADLLLVVVHHLVMDAVSWRILLEDLDRLCHDVQATLPPRSTPYPVWAEALRQAAESASLLEELPFWRAQTGAPNLPLDAVEQGPNDEAGAALVRRELDADSTRRLLSDCHGAYRTRINDLLITALLRTLGDWSGQREQLLTLEAHGREEIRDDIDHSRTVGWFTTLYPVRFELPADDDPGLQIKAIKERLRAVPLNGIGYGILRHLGPEPVRRELAAVPRPKVLFNYLGQLDADRTADDALRWIQQDLGADHDPACPRDHWLDFNTHVSGGRLHLELTFSRRRHGPATAERLADAFLDNLRRLVAYCTNEAHFGYTPSDFPLAQLDQATLDGHPDLNDRRLQDVYPLSPLQSGMLFHSLHRPGSGEYLEQYLCILEAQLDVDAFTRAWQRLIDRHDILRTRFLWDGLDEPLQAVMTDATLPWRIEDWRDGDAASHRARLDEYLAQDRRTGLPLSRAPLMRMLLARLENDRYQLVWSFHHLLMDGWCLHLVLDEVFEHYRALRSGRQAALPRPRPYRDFIAWQRRQDQDAAERYWTALLAGFDSPNRIRLGPVAATDASTASLRRALPAALGQRLQALAREHHLTLNTLVQGAWSLLLNRYSGQRDVVFGVTVSGRTPEVDGAERMIGLFINTLPARIEIEPDGPALELLHQLQAQQIRSREYEYSALARVQACSDIEPGQLLFESIVVYENFPAMAEADAGLRILSEDAIEQTNYPLTLMASAGEPLQLGVAWDPRRFERAAMERLIGHMETVLNAFVDDVAQPLGRIGILTEAEKQTLLRGWNDTRVEVPEPARVDQLVARQDAALPAVADQQALLSYGELNRRADSLAARLQQRGIGVGQRVGVLLERSARLPVVLLAILRSGAAYLPLDPRHPVQRLAFMLADAAAPLLVTESSLAGRASGTDAALMLIDELWEELDDGLRPAPAGVGGDDPAYVIYTSGSTGTPKGVELLHRGLRNLVHWHRRRFDVGAGDRASLLAGLAFDASVWELWPYLACGASLHIPDDDTRLSPTDTLAWLCRERITICFLPTPLAEALLSEDMPDALRLRYLLTGGDKLHAPPGRAIPFTLVNAYGPTENTVVSTAADIEVDASPAAAPAIGRPIDNTRCYVLDENRLPLPVGVPGELCVAGTGLARGYVGRPELTARAFVPDPFADEADALMYRTGDLVRYLPDGNIAFLGRIDHQVKIHGYRIELGEIESLLAQHEAIQDALVVVREDAPGQRRLVAYLVAGGTPPAPEALRTYLAESLPSYMVPAFYLFLDAFPLTANGKIDRAALPVPAAPVDEGRTCPAAPGNEREQLLAAIWRDVLRTDRVGVDDNFFTLGGDSILSIQVVSRARRAGLALTTRLLFDHPTIAALAAAIPEAGDSARTPDAVEGDAPLTPIQHWFFERPLANRDHWNQAYLLAIPETLPAQRLQTALAAVVSHHDSLRLRFRQQDGDWIQSYGESAPVELEVIDLSGHDARGLESAIEAEASRIQAGHRLREGRLLGAALFELGQTRGRRLLLSIHHLVVDGVSWRILLEDLETACRQLETGDSVALPPRTTAIGAWARRLQQQAVTAELEQQRSFWLSTLDNASPSLPVELRGDAPNDVASSREVSVELDAATTRALLQRAPAAYRTRINDLLLAALLRVLCRWRGEARLSLHLEGHGRESLFEDIDLSRTLGWFTSLFPVNLELPAQADSMALIKSVKEQLRAIPDNGIGFGLLRYLHPDADLRRRLASGDRFELLFNYLGQFDQAFDGHALFQPATETAGACEHPDSPRSHLLEVNALVSGDRLRLHWTYSRNRHQEATIRRLAEEHVRALEELVAHCLSDGAGGVTPSDFPLAGLDAPTLDALYARHGARLQDLYPLSPMQEGMLYHTLADPGSPVSFEQYSLELRGDIEPEDMRAAWQIVMDRHPVLRTAFLWQGLERPLQRVMKQVELPWCEEDLRGRPAEAVAARLETFRAEDRQRGFDPGTAPLFRVALFRTARDRAVMIWSFHHVILDGWCMNRVLTEFFEACRRPPVDRVPAARPYRDFIAWLQAQDEQATRDYWERYLAGLETPGALQLAGEDTVAASPVEGPGQQTLCLPDPLAAGLDAMGRRHGLTLNTLVQGAWGILLGRYTGSDDVVFGATVSGRPADLQGVENMVGLFINILPVRVQLDTEEGLIDWLQTLQARQFEATQYQHASPAQIQAASPLANNQPLFDSLLVFENYPLDEAERRHGGLEVVAASLDEMTRFPLNLIVLPGSRLRFVASYDRSRFGDRLVERLLSQLQRVLEELVADPGRRPAAIPAHGREEQQRLLETPPPQLPRSGVLLLQSLADRPARTPALVGDTTLDYGQLLEQAGRVAALLDSRGVRPGDTVAVRCSSAGSVFIALLACLHAGFRCLPLGGLRPGALEKVLRRLNARVLIGDRKADASGLRDVMHLDPADAAQATTEPLAARATSPDDSIGLALDWTQAGATAVAIGAADLEAQLEELSQALPLQAGGAVLLDLPVDQPASLVLGLAALRNGMTLHLPDREGGDAKVQADGPSVVAAPPAALTTWSEDHSGAALVCVAARLDPASAERLAASGRAWKLFPAPGTGLVAACLRIEAATDGCRAGAPLAPFRLRVLRGEHVALTGAPGHLGLDHHRVDGSVETLRTDIAACYRDDGDIVLCDDMSDWCFLSGRPTRLPALERLATRHPGVADAVALATGTDDARLQLFYRLQPGSAVTTTELRRHLQDSLPPHLLPAELIEELDLPADGADQRRQWRLARSQPPERSEPLAPRTDMERRLAAIWQELLQVERVGRQDLFFDIGGHSFLSLELIRRIRQETGVEISPRTLLFSSLEQLAAQCEEPAREASNRQRPAPSFWSWLANRLRGRRPED